MGYLNGSVPQALPWSERLNTIRKDFIENSLCETCGHAAAGCTTNDLEMTKTNTHMTFFCYYYANLKSLQIRHQELHIS